MRLFVQSSAEGLKGEVDRNMGTEKTEAKFQMHGDGCTRAIVS